MTVTPFSPAPILTKGSLCTGTGSLDDALPGQLRWISEVEPAAAARLARTMPEAKNHGDLTRPDFLPESVDLLTSGDPCQSMSSAGRQFASLDPRFLWPHVMRVIRLIRPRHLFLENVQNLASARLLPGADDWRGQRGGILKLRLDDLRAAGYAVRWTILGACVVGAPHHRHRWFLRARYVGTGAPEAVRVEVPCGAPRGSGRVLLPTPRARDHKGGSTGPRPITGGPDLPTLVKTLPAVGWGEYADAVAHWEEVTGRPAPAPRVPAPRGGQRMNAALPEWMMGHPAGSLTDGQSYTAALRQAGNGVLSLQARTAWDLLEV